MSSMLHPVGPERRGTYWRRRLVALVVLAVLVVVATLGIRALMSSADADTPATASPTLDPSQVSPTLAAAPTVTPSVATDPATDSASSSASNVPCEASELSVSLRSDASTYGPGRAPKFSVTVENTSDVTCSAEIGSSVRTFTATDSSGAKVWSSSDCQQETASQVFALEPGKSKSMSTTWSRQRSAAGCPDGQTVVDDGSYTIDATWNGATTAPASIALSN
ncbi:MAG: hypothetical protein ACRYF3_00300 [Janthinobacterium lividum]